VVAHRLQQFLQGHVGAEGLGRAALPARPSHRRPTRAPSFRTARHTPADRRRRKVPTLRRAGSHLFSVDAGRHLGARRRRSRSVNGLPSLAVSLYRRSCRARSRSRSWNPGSPSRAAAAGRGSTEVVAIDEHGRLRSRPRRRVAVQQFERMLIDPSDRAQLVAASTSTSSPLCSRAA